MSGYEREREHGYERRRGAGERERRRDASGRAAEFGRADGAKRKRGAGERKRGAAERAAERKRAWRQGEYKQSTLENLWHIVAGFIIVIIAFFIGSILIRLIFQATGKPPAPWDDLLGALFSGLLGFTILIVGFLGIGRAIKAHQLRALQRRVGVSPYDRYAEEAGDGRSITPPPPGSPSGPPPPPQAQPKRRGDRGRDFADFFGRDILDALERIASGDFNVLIPSHEHDPLAGLVESVNRMARQLGTVEGQRQQFIADVSHEIQSPLTSITGFAGLLKDPALNEEQRLHYLGIIEQESRRLSRLADNLLRLTALDSEDRELERSRYALDEQLRSVILTLEPQWAAQGVRVELETGDANEVGGAEGAGADGASANGTTAPLPFDGDQELMEQAWINLIGNAIKFTPEGGTVTVSIEAGGAKPNGKPGESQTATTWTVRITDTGIGIAEDDLLHIFERFYRADKARGRTQGGNGLGLPLARRIIELHGGSVAVTSAAGQGSTFAVTL